MASPPLCRWLEAVDSGDTAEVGGKNASLGEMIQNLGAAGVRVPGGFATTAAAYWGFVDSNNLQGAIAEQIGRLGHGGDVEDVGPAIRDLFTDADMPADLVAAISEHYEQLSRRAGSEDVAVAVRSSATAEDLPEASFAGQQETFLNVRGTEDLLDACQRCYASLFTDRAIAYREHHGFDHLDVALSVGVQRMVRSGDDGGAAGVMFSVDTETGFPRNVMIDAAWGLGESVVAGSVDPDHYVVFKPLLDDPALTPILTRTRGAKEQKIVVAADGEEPTEQVGTTSAERSAFVLSTGEILQLARHAVSIEDHYGFAMDMEWAKDPHDDELFIVQARPETVQSRRSAGHLRTYSLDEPGAALVTGEAIGQAIAAGSVRVVGSPDEGDDFPDGAVLVTAMTDPDWLPLMKRAAAIVTDHGGRTSHAAIVSRELALPAVIGTGDATAELSDGTDVTVSCAEGDQGHVYSGHLQWTETDIDTSDIPSTRTEVMLNLANPSAALRWWELPADGVGLARMEFIVGNHVRIHPLALLHPDRVDSEDASAAIEELTAGYDDPVDYFVDELASGIALIAASQHPRPVIVRMSDFKTNEYADLIGGRAFEPEENNPMLGWRGASRYYHPDYRDGFALECRAIRRVREEIGLTNVVIMIPFCRTLGEADAVLAVLAEEGLVRGQGGLEVYVMAEIPANVLLADSFAERFDGFSIGSNDLTQLVLGVDRDSALLRDLFDENDPAVRAAIHQLIEGAHRQSAKIGLCGQAPSDHPAFARYLVSEGIDSMSVTPDSFLAVKESVAAAEAEVGAARTGDSTDTSSEGSGAHQSPRAP